MCVCVCVCVVVLLVIQFVSTSDSDLYGLTVIPIYRPMSFYLPSSSLLSFFLSSFFLPPYAFPGREHRGNAGHAGAVEAVGDVNTRATKGVTVITNSVVSALCTLNAFGTVRT